MQIPPKLLTTIVIGSVLLGCIIQKQLTPKNIDKVQDKTQEQSTTTIHEHKNADGSSDIDTKIVDAKKEQHSETSISTSQPDWFIAASSSINEIYGLSVSRRILGPIYIGVYGRTDKEVGLNVGMQF